MGHSERQYYKLLKDYTQIINSSLNETEVLNMIAENFTKALDVKACSVYLLSRDRKVLKVRASYGLSDAYLNKGALDADKSIADTLSGKPVMVQDVTKDSRIQYPKEAAEEGIASILSVPITVMGKTIGALRIYTSVPYEFSVEEREFINDLVDMGALAIDNAQYFRSFREICSLINKNLNLNEVLDAITLNVAKTLITKGCAIFLLSRAENRLKLSSSYGLSDDYINKGPIVADKSLSECLEGKWVYIADAVDDPRVQYQKAAIEEQIASILSVPITVAGNTIGVFRIYTTKPYQFNENEREFISGISEVGGIAIENARMYDRLKYEHENLINETHKWFEYGRTD
jgi:signal transduction protein with GAF and PtsI domain